MLAILLPSAGGYTGSSYRYGSNARQIALSNSLVSNYNKGYNPLTNPALLGRESLKLEYGLSYFSMSLDRSIQTFSISIPAPPSASIGLSLVMTSVDDIQGTDENGDAIIGTYTTSTGKHEILMTGSIINRFHIFSIASSNNTSSGCYYQYSHSSSSWTSCYSATGAKLYGTPRAYRTNIEQTSDEMMEKRRQEQIIKESMRGNRRLSDKDLKAFKRYKQLLQILNSTDKEPLKRFLHSFRTN